MHLEFLADSGFLIKRILHNSIIYYRKIHRCQLIGVTEKKDQRRENENTIEKIAATIARMDEKIGQLLAVEEEKDNEEDDFTTVKSRKRSGQKQKEQRGNTIKSK